MYGDLARQYEPQRTNLQEEFEAKNDILRPNFLELFPIDYLSTIFPDKKEEDDLIIVLGTLKGSKGNVIEICSFSSLSVFYQKVVLLEQQTQTYTCKQSLTQVLRSEVSDVILSLTKLKT